MSSPAGPLLLEQGEIGIDHFSDELGETRPRRPAQFFPRLARIAEKMPNLQRPEIARIDFDQTVLRTGEVAPFFEARSAPFDPLADMGESELDEFAHTVRLTGRQDEVVGLLGLKDPPHALDIVLGVSPITKRVEIADIDTILHVELDGSNRSGDLAGDEGLAANGALVIEQDAIAGEQTIAFPIVSRDPVGVELGRGVGALRQEGCRFILRCGRCAIKFGRARLIKACLFHAPENTYGLEQSQCAETIGIPGIFRGLEAHLDVALRREIVDLVGLCLLHHPNEIGRIGQITIMQEQPHAAGMRVLIEVIDARGIERRAPALEPMHLISLGQQKLGQIGTVLPGNSCDECASGHGSCLDRKSKEARIGLQSTANWPQIAMCSNSCRTPGEFPGVRLITLPAWGNRPQVRSAGDVDDARGACNGECEHGPPECAGWPARRTKRMTAAARPSKACQCRASTYGFIRRNISRDEMLARISTTAFAFCALLTTGSTAFAADHREAPLVNLMPALDLNDLYAFQSPEVPGNIVLIMTVNPGSLPGFAASYAFDANAIYRFAIDRNGDAVFDTNIDVLFGPLTDGVQTVEARIGGRVLVDGTTTPGTVLSADPVDPTINVNGDFRLFAGPADDPFFFDGVGFARVVSGNGGFRREDAFAGLNVSSIVLELPARFVAGGSDDLQIEALTYIEERGDNDRDLKSQRIRLFRRFFRQFERTGNPAVSTALIPAARRDEFNQSLPKDDAERFGGDIVAALGAFGTPEENVAILASVAVPDTLGLRLSEPAGFPNGRRLEDDVIDTLLQLILGDTSASDGVGRNDVRFREGFPYLAPPQQSP